MLEKQKFFIPSKDIQTGNICCNLARRVFMQLFNQRNVYLRLPYSLR